MSYVYPKRERRKRNPLRVRNHNYDLRNGARIRVMSGSMMIGQSGTYKGNSRVLFDGYSKPMRFDINRLVVVDDIDDIDDIKVLSTEGPAYTAIQAKALRAMSRALVERSRLSKGLIHQQVSRSEGLAYDDPIAESFDGRTCIQRFPKKKAMERKRKAYWG